MILDMEHMNLQQKLAFLKMHSKWKCMNKRELLAEHETTWQTNGLSDLTYQTLQIEPFSEETKVRCPCLHPFPSCIESGLCENRYRRRERE